MTDLISRQDAIDAIHGMFSKCLARDRAIDAINSVLSEMRWISCTERVPKTEEKVLCCTQTKKGTANIVLGYYASGRWCCGMNSNVVAWMPLPEVYKENE